MNLSKLKSALLYLYLWLFLGVITGTFLLVVVVRALVVCLRLANIPMQIENIIVSIIIILYVIFSVFFAKWVCKWLINYARPKTKVVFHLLVCSLFLFCVYYWLNPKPMVIYAVSQDQHFAIGSYPNLNAMFELKRANYTTVVSLLNGKTIPFESYLLQNEERNAKLAGLKFINIPMLPWITENQQADPMIVQLYKQGNAEKYYVHCVLGQDRTQAFLHILSSYVPVKTVLPKTAREKKWTLAMETGNPIEFERGNGFLLDKNVLLTPLLLNFELFQVINIYEPQTVVSLFKATDPNSFQKDKPILESQKISFVSMPVNAYPYDPTRMMAVVDYVRSLNKKVLIHDFYMPPISIPAGGFLLSYLTNLPAIPLGSFDKPLTDGIVKQIAPNVVLGPTPIEQEYKLQLKNKGIRGVVYIGLCKGTDYGQYHSFALSTHLQWQCFSPNDPKLIDFLAKGGPWYVFGPDLPTVEPTLNSKFREPYLELLKRFKLPNV